MVVVVLNEQYFLINFILSDNFDCVVEEIFIMVNVGFSGL